MQTITRCPPPSRIFHGRQTILDKMHGFFQQDLHEQHIFLLHGLGGAGKTQTALKFIQESSSDFSEVFLIDTSTLETIETGLKNIAVTKDAGSTAQDALQWLISQSQEWLLLFDNADDPKINLHKFFPQCTHGNILITSRNPGLRVHAGSYALVSDMEETDAVELLLKSSAVATTPINKDIATEIVKALCYLPLAIIQAGAFISQSGVLGQYLDLYTENRAHLLSEKPVQSHDDYAWTVYTTWQISFDQLSKPAATFLQLCSFLHHEGISEEIFSRASVYDFPAHYPSKEELKDPLEFLSQFLGPAGTWDSLCFMKVTNEIRAYSLMSHHLEKNMFSIHPLVHIWSQSTLTDKERYHYQMVAILGMSMATVPNENLQLAGLEVLPHLDSLIGGGTNLTPDFRSEYGRIYSRAGRWKAAKQLQLAVLADQRNVLGEDHPDTLLVMGRLASAYWRGGELKEAEELEIVVIEKRRKILGEDH
ncbi:P-loop containing nucleoside triphosphate hydrolase protein, partial [Mycena latifolia]